MTKKAFMEASVEKKALLWLVQCLIARKPDGYQAIPPNACDGLLLFKGHFGRLNYRENVVPYLEVHAFH